MIIPKLEDLHAAQFREIHFMKHYPEFYRYIIETYKDEPQNFSEKLCWYYHDLKDYPKCPICGKIPEFLNVREGYRRYCSRKCLNSDPEKKEKGRQTCIKRYGGPAPCCSQDVRDKSKITNKERYGCENPMQNEDIKNKSFNTTRERYKGIGNQSLHRKNKFKQSHNNDTSSSLEKIVRGWLDSLNLEYQINVRNIIPPKELDIYIPSKKVAIEINGCYWHSDQEKPKNYHIDKFKDCEEHGIQLIQIWEDWLINKPDIIQSILLTKLGECNDVVYARQCEIREVNSKDSREFLEDNHIQGYCNAKYSYGLYYKDELVSLMTFGAQRKCLNSNPTEGEYELLRFCNMAYIRVVGGASKLFKYFLKLHKPKKVISFSSCDISNCNLYKTLGFESDENISQSYWYVDPEDFQRYHRSSFTKAAIVKKGWKEKIDSSWTEASAMNEIGIMRIYDAGQRKWTLDLKY